MKISKGDRVKFLNDVGGGVVISISDKGMAMVRDADGFDFPVRISELVKIVTDEEEEILGIEQKPDSEKADENFLDEDIKEVLPDICEMNKIDKDNPLVYFALVPSDMRRLLECDLDAYLVNDCSYRLYYVFARVDGEQFIPLRSGSLEPNSKFFLQSFNRGIISANPVFAFQALIYRASTYFPVEPLNTRVNVMPLSLYDTHTFTSNAFFEEKAVLYPLNVPDLTSVIEQTPASQIEMVVKEKEQKRLQKVAKPNPRPGVREVDLHMHELVETEAGMTNKDKIDLQISFFRKELNKAIRDREKKIVFIHGKGEGRLRQEIRYIIDKEYRGTAVYQDASFEEYGFGATLVLLGSAR